MNAAAAFDLAVVGVDKSAASHLRALHVVSETIIASSRQDATVKLAGDIA